MLLAFIANNQNVVPAHLPKVIVDRGGGGPQWPSFDIVDIQGALSSFVEVSGEGSVARAVRRQTHIRQHLEGLRDRRERREGAAFLAGAMLAESAAQERIDDLLAQIDGLKASAAPLPVSIARGAYAAAAAGSSSIAGPLLLLGAGIFIGVVIARRR